MKLIVVLCLLLVSGSAYAEMKEVKARGLISWGGSDSGIESLDPRCCSFVTKSDVGSKIFETCKVNKECELVATVDTKNMSWLIISVSSVRKINVDIEPLNDVIKSAACWSSGVSFCDDEKLVVDVVSYCHKVINGEAMWVVDYDLSLQNDANSCVGWHERGHVQLIKRGLDWIYSK